MKKIITVVLMTLVILLLTNCSNSSRDKINFPYRFLPVYSNGRVYEEVVSDNEDITVKYLSNGSIVSITNFYDTLFSSEMYNIVKEDIADDIGEYSGYIEDYYFHISIYKSELSDGDGLNEVEMMVSKIQKAEESMGGVVNETGEPQILEIKQVNEEGCYIEIVDEISGIEAEIRIQPTAVNGEITLKVGFCDVFGNSRNLELSNRAIYLDLGGYENFSIPLEITITYDTENKIPIPCSIDSETGRLLPATILEINESRRKVTFLAMYSSSVTWLYAPAIKYTGGYSDYGIRIPSAATSYLPSSDGFSEINQGSEYQSGGECFGMASFSIWYYKNKKLENGPLYNSFNTGDFGYRTLEDGTRDYIFVQDIIATRAHRHLNEERSAILDEALLYSSVYSEAQDSSVSDNCVSLMTIIASISLLNEPICTMFYGDMTEWDAWNSQNVVIGHALVAYGYYVEGSKVHIMVYDCNMPGNDEVEVIYNLENDTFKITSDAISYDVSMQKKLFCIGPGTFNNDASFDKIYEDALQNFENTQIHIEITSHEYGDTVSEPYTTLKGYVDNLDVISKMGEKIIDIIEIIMSDGSVYSQQIDSETGEFAIDIPLVSGSNFMNFNLVYIENYGSYTTRRTLDHDMNSDFLLNCDIGVTPVLITLTWDSQPDVDLYVFDPTGAVAWYGEMITNDGGELDIDDTSSYGPEHFTLTKDDIVRWGQEYQVKLHYYDGIGPTQYTVIIMLNSGTNECIIKRYTGIIDTSDSLNAAPYSTGEDWVDIDVVIPLMP